MQRVCCAPPFSYCAYEEVGDWLIVGLDSCDTDDAGGFLNEDEFERLSVIVEQSAARHVMVCLHHPPVPMRSRWLDSVGLDNGTVFLERMSGIGRVRATIFGHVHQAYDEMHDQIRVIATPSTCRQFLPLADEFAVDDKPPAYRRIALGAGGDIETDVIWVHDE